MRYWIVDAFTDTRFTGNPAAVVLPDAFPPDDVMQSIAAENNLAETAFAVRDGADWRLRWFTPTVEVDLCGHATLATAHVLALDGQGRSFRFHTRSGPLATTVDADGAITLDFPARDHVAIDAPAGLERLLGAPPAAVLRSADLIAVLESADQVAALSPDRAAILALPGGALIVTAPGGPDGADITSRYFAPAYGIDEDQVTGSLHTQVVPYWVRRLGRDRLRAHQASARGGWLTCTLVRRSGADRVHLGGTAVLYASGTIATLGAA